LGHIAVVDREKHAVVAKWELRNAAANISMALDEANQRLFVGCRHPPKLLVMDSDNGNVIARPDIPQDCDDVFYDAANHRIYAAGGEGYLAMIDQEDASHYAPLPRKPTGPGARTALFWPDTGQLYVAIPARDSKAASILVLDYGRP
ncbi:MAG: YncE family protein, partial [Tepidisphaerales bacterium]